MMWYISRRDARFLEDCSLLVSFNKKCLDLALYFHWRKGSKPRAGLRPPTGKGLTQLRLQLEGVAREGTQAGSTYHVPLLYQSPELHSLVLQLSWCPQPSPQFSGSIHSDRLGVGPPLVTDDFWLSPRHFWTRAENKVWQMQRTGRVHEEHKGQVGQNIGCHIP